MPCQIGITTRPEKRRREWERDVVGLAGWKILEVHASKQMAQEAEVRLAQRLGCDAEPGGADAPGLWSVYHFEYSRKRRG